MAVDLLAVHRRDRGEILRLFSRYPYKCWQRRLQGIDSGRLAQLFWDVAEGQFNQPGSSALVAWRRRPREAIGFAIVSPHTWHSEILGLPMGRILHFLNYIEPERVGPVLLDELLRRAEQAGIEHLVCRIDGSDWPNVHLLESRGFRCVDCSLKMARRLDDLSGEEAVAGPAGFEVREFDANDLNALQGIAARSHQHNHFFNDPALDRNRASALFAQWLRRCASGLAEFILVAERPDGRVVGFVTALSNSALARVVGLSVGIIDYIAVDREVEGRGVGRALLRAALVRLARNHSWAELRTSQDNYRAVAFYNAAGFRTVASDFIFHRSRQVA